eukprot:TRINITY_DN763_c0_g1_i1.p1 TRINITY_DN763_c0_g1~~TRINITY_DN763_c0_g1_i1.p1  ORF type:complete len:438 (-),score=135.02 TRINITY_DN763_c0_g1_i1:6-1253(-)
MNAFKEKFPDVDEGDAMRFLLARNFDIKESIGLYERYLEWLDKFKPGNLTYLQWKKEIEKDRGYLLGYSKDKMPIVTVVCRNHFPEKEKNSWETTVHFACLISRLFIEGSDTPSTSKMIAIADCRGVTMKNVDMKFIKHAIDVYQEYFPERLHSCYVVGLPAALLGIWSVIEKMIDSRTRERIHLLKKSEMHKLSDEFGEEIIPACLGGKAELVHDRLWELYLKSSTTEKEDGTKNPQEVKEGATPPSGKKEEETTSPEKEDGSSTSKKEDAALTSKKEKKASGKKEKQDETSMSTKEEATTSKKEKKDETSRSAKEGTPSSSKKEKKDETSRSAKEDTPSSSKKEKKDETPKISKKEKGDGTPRSNKKEKGDGTPRSKKEKGDGTPRSSKKEKGEGTPRSGKKEDEVQNSEGKK